MQQKPATIRLNEESRALVVGLGKTGLSCARYLAAKGVQLAITDSREEPPGLNEVREELPDAALFLGGFDRDVFARANLLVVSPGVPLSTPEIQQAIARGIPVVGDVELFAMAVEAPVVVITGSNGKSTVTTLLGDMAQAAGLRTAVGGNLGEPALDLLGPEVELYVLELSSFQLETTSSLQAVAATVLNISADHMDRYRDIEHYANTKAEILKHSEVAVINADDPRVMAMETAGEKLFFTLGSAEDRNSFNVQELDGEDWLCRGSEPMMSTRELVMAGQHNMANALAALALGSALDLSPDIMLRVLRNFRGLPYRTEYLGEKEGVRWYNDSKGTNPGATIAALNGLAGACEGGIVLIAGGDCKQADFTGLGSVIGQTVSTVVLIGVDAPLINAVIPDNVITLEASSMVQAVELAAESARDGDLVILSPACASFDMFDNYQQRGDVFRNIVQERLR